MAFHLKESELVKTKVEGKKDSSPTYCRVKEMVFRRLGEEMILVPIRKGIGDFNSFYVLNELGSFLWNQLAEPKKAEDLLEAILEKFEVSTDEARNDLQPFMAELLQLNAIQTLSLEMVNAK